MAALDTFSSSKSEHLQRMFGSVWRDLIRDLVWELHDRLDKDEVVFRVERRVLGIRLSFAITWGHIATALTQLVGPRPS